MSKRWIIKRTILEIGVVTGETKEIALMQGLNPHIVTVLKQTIKPEEKK